jgi:hypothetical protein
MSTFYFSTSCGSCLSTLKFTPYSSKSLNTTLVCDLCLFNSTLLHAYYWLSPYAFKIMMVLKLLSLFESSNMLRNVTMLFNIMICASIFTT